MNMCGWYDAYDRKRGSCHLATDKGGLVLIGVSSIPIEVAPVQLIRGGKTIEGWAGVTPADSDDALRFAELRGVRAMIETYPLEKAAEAYAHMMSGNAEFRVVLTM